MVFKGGSISLTELQKRIIHLLKVNLYLSTNTLARACEKPYPQILYNLLSLKDKGLVKDIYVRQYYPNYITYIVCRFWYLPENEKEVIKSLESDSHTLLLKRPK